MSHSNPNGYKTILVTGGGGYVGSALVPALLDAGYRVRVLDTFWYGKQVFGDYAQRPELELLEVDLRDSNRVGEAMKGVDAVIHLACISNDPSFELNPNLGKSINYDCFAGLMDGAIAAGVKRFIYASSSSIYGVKETPDVREDAEPLPLTDYSRFKLDCERDLLARTDVRGMDRVIIRPATVCGYAPRLRLDLSVNILTNHAVNKNKITVFGGAQLRPNFHVRDCAELYVKCLALPAEQIDGKVFNAGYQNLSLNAIANKVRDIVGSHVEIVHTPTDDNRSYHISSEKILRELGFTPRFTIEDAIRELVEAFGAGKIPDSFTNPLYFNIKRMQEIHLR